MIRMNIVYDDMLDDVDLIDIPENIYDQIDDIVRTFILWLPTAPQEDRDYWIVENGNIVGGNLETVGFVKWLNRNYCNGIEKVLIIKQHVDYCPEYNSIEF